MQNRYKYLGEPLTPRKAEPLILTLFAGTPKIKRKYIRAGVTEFHKSQGGLEPDAAFIATALASLRDKGFAEQLGDGYWRILSIYDYDSDS